MTTWTKINFFSSSSRLWSILRFWIF
jgi:hypothetical protein